MNPAWELFPSTCAVIVVRMGVSIYKRSSEVFHVFIKVLKVIQVIIDHCQVIQEYLIYWMLIGKICELTLVFFVATLSSTYLTPPPLPGPWRRGGRPLRRKGPGFKGRMGPWTLLAKRSVESRLSVRLASSRGWMMTMSRGPQLGECFSVGVWWS